MYLTPLQTLIMILAVAAGTQITRWLPFWLFPENREPPVWVLYLGRVLPAATMGLLVVYCLPGPTRPTAPRSCWRSWRWCCCTAGRATCSSPLRGERRCTCCWCR